MPSWSTSVSVSEFEIGDDGRPGGLGALVGGGEAVLERLLQNEREKAAGDVAADRARVKPRVKMLWGLAAARSGILTVLQHVSRSLR